ncbi:O131 family O-antigen polymerase, partial [Escherichia coli]
IVMLYYLVSIDRYFGNRDKSNKLDLLLWATLFLKITAMLTIERQAVASFFILYAISDIRRKYLWLFIGCLFHLSTPVVYLAVRFVLNTKTNKKVLVSCIALILFVVFSHQLLSVINHILPNDKVGYVLYYIN